MNNGAVAASTAAAEALKAIGPIVCLEPRDFLAILTKTEKPLVVQSPHGFLTKYKYLTSYKGLVFFTKSKEPLFLPTSTEIVNAKSIHVPEY